MTWLVVTDLVTVPPRREWGTPEDYDGLERYGKEFLRAKGAEVSASRRLRMAGNDAVEVSGVLGDLDYTTRLLYRGRRRFEIRCLAPPVDDGWPCESAFTSFEILDLPDPQNDSETPRVLHLRDARFGIEFDAPDDSWLAIGPRTGGGGAQVVWIWRSNQGQVDVQALDLSIVPGTPPDQATFARKQAEGFEAKGATVKIEPSTIAGSPCLHLVVDRPDGYQQDMFILNERNTNYSILITQHIRNAALVRRVRGGFKLKAR